MAAEPEACACDSTPSFSDIVKDRMEAMHAVNAPDCCLRISDDTKFPVHKIKLVKQSTVFR